jgi:hypothetical protein
MRRRADPRSTGVLRADSTGEKLDSWVMWICRGFSVYIVNGIPLFRPTPYLRLRTFGYAADGHLHETTTTTTEHP